MISSLFFRKAFLVIQPGLGALVRILHYARARSPGYCSSLSATQPLESLFHFCSCCSLLSGKPSRYNVALTVCSWRNPTQIVRVPTQYIILSYAFPYRIRCSEFWFPPPKLSRTAKLCSLPKFSYSHILQFYLAHYPMPWKSFLIYFVQSLNCLWWED